MQLEHHFTVPVPVAQAWEVLLDVERIAPCMPGATVTSFDGETIEGQVKVKVGPIQVTYAGTAKFVEKDEAGRRAVIDAKAKESRGAGTANATIVAVLTETSGDSTDVTVTTDLAITGRPAQFGRGVMAEVGNKILGRFADCLAEQLGSGAAGEVRAADTSATIAASTAPTPSQAASTPSSPSRATSAPVPASKPALRPVDDDDAIDLLDTAGLPVLKRLAPVVGGVFLLLVIWRLVVRPRG